jgi:hypothetical protein
LFVAVAKTGTGNRVMTSPDGITWTTRASAADRGWGGLTWSAELSLFVAVANSGTGNRVMTSSDGINWTTRASAADNSWTSVAWSPELSLFVAVASVATGPRIMTSSDSITWTTRASGTTTYLNCVVWSPELSLFLAVANGSGDGVITSSDGIRWTTRVSGVDNVWSSVAWSAELSRFVAVAFTGANRVLTSQIALPNSRSTALISPEYLQVTDGNLNLNGNLTTSTLLATTSISTGAVYAPLSTITNGVFTNISTSGLALTDLVATNISTATLIASTGATLGNLTINTVNVTPSIGDISTEYWTQMANNTNGTVFGLAFSNSIVRSFFANAHTEIIRTTGGNLYSKHELKGIQLQSGWMLNQTYIGDNTGITFGIGSNGQVYYTSSNIANYSQSNVHYRALVTSTTSGILL